MYTNQSTNKARLHHQLIDDADTPCALCHGTKHREIHRIVPGHNGGEYTLDNVQVVCRACHLSLHPQSKFQIGDLVSVNGRTPAYVNDTRHRPRTIIDIVYSPERQCNYYTLGSNGRGSHSGNGNPLDGAEYHYRSYMLVTYEPRRYHHHRRYNTNLRGITRERVENHTAVENSPLEINR